MISGYFKTDAIAFLRNEKHKADWDELHEKCQWSTAFQDRRYVGLWYELYQENYAPLLVVEEVEGFMVGIFPLAVRRNGEIVGAGYPQAEYHAWIAKNEMEVEFFVKAVQWLQANYPGQSVNLKYLPHLLSFEALRNNKFLKPLSFWKKYDQPVVEINEPKLSADLKKKWVKNSVKRLGELKFEKLEKGTDFGPILDRMIVSYEFRKAAVYGSEFFADDKKKESLHYAFFRMGYFTLRS